MKILRFAYENKNYLGKLEKGQVYKIKSDLAHKDDSLELIKTYKATDLAFEKEGLDLNKVKVICPISRTENDILCVGLNYISHIEETRGRFEKNPYATYFSKRAQVISGPEDTIYLDTKIDDAMDYETELAVVIGKKGKNIKGEDALDHVYAYTIINDYSARNLQQRHKQFFKGKSLDGYTALGPYLVTKDEIQNPNDLKLKTRINGEERQNSSTSHMIRNLSTLISDLSQGLTLVPGDIITTGTPKGVGVGFTPPRFLKSGNIVESEIENIGILRSYIK